MLAVRRQLQVRQFPLEILLTVGIAMTVLVLQDVGLIGFPSTVGTNDSSGSVLDLRFTFGAEIEFGL